MDSWDPFFWGTVENVCLICQIDGEIDEVGLPILAQIQDNNRIWEFLQLVSDVFSILVLG